MREGGGGGLTGVNAGGLILDTTAWIRTCTRSGQDPPSVERNRSLLSDLVASCLPACRSLPPVVYQHCHCVHQVSWESI